MEKISWTDCARNEEVLPSVQEGSNVLRTVKWWKADWIGHNLRMNCLLKQVVESKREVKGRRGGKRNQLLDDFKETRRYCKLKEEALSHWVENSLWMRLWTCRKADWLQLREEEWVSAVKVATPGRLYYCQQQSFLETSDGKRQNRQTSCWTENSVIEFAWVWFTVLGSIPWKPKLYSLEFLGETSSLCSVINRIYIIAQSNIPFIKYSQFKDNLNHF